jgi:hypothetical protein
VLADRRDGQETAAIGIEQAAQRRRSIEPTEAAPVDRAVAADQCCAVAIDDQRVVADRQVTGIATRQ